MSSKKIGSESRPFAGFLVTDTSWAGPVAAGEQLGPTLQVVCPVCRDNYVSNDCPAEDLTGWESAKDRPALSSQSYRWNGRGDGTCIPMICESGHRFVLCMGFHKGETYLYVALDDSGKPNPYAECET